MMMYHIYKILMQCIWIIIFCHSLIHVVDSGDETFKLAGDVHNERYKHRVDGGVVAGCEHEHQELTRVDNLFDRELSGIQGQPHDGDKAPPESLYFILWFSLYLFLVIWHQHADQRSNTPTDGNHIDDH